MAALLGAVWVHPAIGQDRPAGSDHGHAHAAPGERLGKVDFPIDCNAAAQAQFNRAMALYHSFVWSAAMKAFEEVAQADPACGMAHWGRAMVILDNPFTWPANLAPKLDSVAAALDDARSAGLQSQREKDYVEALETFVRDRDSRDHRTRLQAYDEAMARLAARYPDDKEATILSALATSANFDPTDKDYTNQLAAARALEPLLESDPDHPGVAHYLIHSYDYPPIAEHGREAALKYSRIAPDAAHALHMPSHIFTRVGDWQESIEANRASAAVAGDTAFDGHHARDYKVYAHLQLGQDRAAETVWAESRAAQPVDHFAAAYAYAAMPARLAIERRDWEQAKDLALHPAPEAYPWKKYPQSEAVNAFARGVGAAMAGDAAAARREHGRLLGLRDAAQEAKLGYWAEQIDIQAALVAGLAMCAEGNSQACIDAMSVAADREDATEKHVVTPGPIVPARELLADVLLDQGKAEQALEEYAAVLAKEPNRYRATLGAGRAARAAGDEARAKDYFERLVALGANADDTREGLDEARAFVRRG